MKIRYSRRALLQLEEILFYTEQHNPRAALSVNAAIKRKIGLLGRFPYSSGMTDRPGVRVLPIVRYPYLVFYSVDEEAREVHILRIRHAARNPANDET